MAEETPSTGLTLGKVKQFLDKNCIAYTMKKSSALILGDYEWDIKCKEKVDDNRSQKRNYRLYTRGLEDDSEASWEGNQCPAAFSIPTSTTSEPSFTSRLEAFIKAKTDEGKIKFGFIVQVSELSKKALCNAIMPDKTDKTLLVSEDAEGKFSFEILQ